MAKSLTSRDLDIRRNPSTSYERHARYRERSEISGVGILPVLGPQSALEFIVLFTTPKIQGLRTGPLRFLISDEDEPPRPRKR